MTTPNGGFSGLMKHNQRNDRTEQLFRIPTGQRQTSWLFTSAAGKLNQGLPGSNSTSGQSGSWTRDLRISRQAPEPLCHTASSILRPPQSMLLAFVGLVFVCFASNSWSVLGGIASLDLDLSGHVVTIGEENVWISFALWCAIVSGTFRLSLPFTHLAPTLLCNQCMLEGIVTEREEGRALKWGTL